jgi:hypothetical protein
MINKYVGFFFLAAAAIGSTACGGSGDAADPNGTGTSQPSSTATAAPLPSGRAAGRRRRDE